MEFYHINDNYIDYLRENADRHVPYNKPEKKQRPYVGIISNIGGFDYFIPLHSPKEHSGRFQSRVTDIIYDPDDSNEIIAYLKYNNLIPVKETEYSKVDFDSIKISDNKYYILLEKERRFLHNKEEKIKTKAKLVYEKFKSDKQEDAFYKRCCLDFPKLEECCGNYKVIVEQ